jgi:hypothetical protein
VKTAKSKLFDILEGVFSQRTVLVRAVARLIIGGGGCIFIYSCSTRRISFFTVCDHE